MTWHERCHASGCSKVLHGGDHCGPGKCALMADEDPMLRFVREPYRSQIDRLAETCGPATDVAIGDDGVYVTFTNGHGHVFS